jgi:transposase
MRGLLHEYGIVIRKGAAALRRALPELLEGNDERIPAVLKAVVVEQFERFTYLAQRRDRYDRQIAELCKQDHRCRRLLQVPGIGSLSATVSLHNERSWPLPGFLRSTPESES